MASYDIIGSKEKAIAIVEISKSPKNVKKIASEILKNHKNVKSVLGKISKRKGVFRISQYKILSGDKNTEVTHKEHNCLLKLDPRKVYFSSREGTERLRISKLVKSNETIMVMFAGIGSFPVVIAKSQPLVKKIISIEINPIAVKYMKDNVRINKQQEKITPIQGDVRKTAKEWFNKCNRVIMPLPKDSWKYFDLALKCIEKKGTIHLYTIESENNIEKSVRNKINRYKNKITNYSIKKVLPYAPRIYKYCIDIKIKAVQITQRRHKQRPNV